MPMFTLAADGDSYERTYYDLFLRAGFAAYEEVWLRFVIPLTNRPRDIQFKSDPELAAIGRSPHDICIAQLHYSVFRHLVRAFNIRMNRPTTVDLLCAGMSAIVGAQDTAFELLERFRKPGQYDPWLDKRRVKGGPKGGKQAQDAWKDHDNYPLQDIRDYRNNLMHGRIMPGIGREPNTRVPAIGQELRYLDWRCITAIPHYALPIHDFIEPQDVLEDLWSRTLTYIQSKWVTAILPKL